MNVEQFTDAYNTPRNGTDAFHYNPLYRQFQYSDGVKECAEAGCYWLLDVLGTELTTHMRDRRGEFCVVKVHVKDGSATITGELRDDDPAPYKRTVEWTDMPPGEWTLFVQYNGSKFFCILPSEY